MKVVLLQILRLLFFGFLDFWFWSSDSGEQKPQDLRKFQHFLTTLHTFIIFIPKSASEVIWTKVGGNINSQTTIVRGTELFFNNAAENNVGSFKDDLSTGKIKIIDQNNGTFAPLNEFKNHKHYNGYEGYFD